MSLSPEKPKRRWVAPTLFASLTVNLLVAGVVAGAFLSPDGPRKQGVPSERAIRGVLGEPFFQSLPKDDRRAMVQTIIKNREEFREGRERLRLRVESFLEALRADVFDRDEVERLLGEQRDAALRRQTFGESLLLDRLESMTQEERLTYAIALESRLKGLKRR